MPPKSIAIGGFFGSGIEQQQEMAGVKDSQLNARLAGVPQHFLEVLPQWLAIDASLSFKTVWKASVVVLSRYNFKRSSNFMPRASTLLAWADVRVGFPIALMRVVALMAFFCSIHSFLCN